MNIDNNISDFVQTRCASVIHSLRRHRLACKCITHRPALEPCFSGMFSAETTGKDTHGCVHPGEFRTSVVGASRQGPEILYTII